MSLSATVVSAGDYAVEAIVITPAGIVTDCAIPSDAPEVSEPTMKLTLSDFTSLVAPSIATAGASETESSEDTSLQVPATPLAAIASLTVFTPNAAALARPVP